MSEAQQESRSTELGATVFMFLIGTSFTLPLAAPAGHDAWISILFAVILGSGISWFYMKLCVAFPGRTLIEIAEQLLGSVGGKIIAIVYLWYSFYLAVLVLKDITAMISAVGLPKTPNLMVALPMIALMVIVSYLGIETLGRCAIVIVGFLLVETFLSIIFLIPDFHFEYLLPMFDCGLRPVLDGTIITTAFPFGEIILFSMVVPTFVTEQKKMKKIFFWMIGAGMVLLVVQMRNILVIGDLASRVAYPTYAAYQYISIADFVERIEPIVFITEVASGFVKISVCFYVAIQVFKQLLKTDETRSYFIPVALLILEISLFVYQNNGEMVYFVKVWPFYSFPVEVMIPLLLWVMMLVKKRRKWSSSSP